MDNARHAVKQTAKIVEGGIVLVVESEAGIIAAAQGLSPTAVEERDRLDPDDFPGLPELFARIELGIF